MEERRMDRQFDFFREIDKEKFIERQTYLTDAARKENDAEHAWHMAVMAILLSEQIHLFFILSLPHFPKSCH